jgi:peptidase S24-like protein
MSLSERLIKYISSKNLSINGFERKIGVSQGLIAKAIKSNSVIGSDKIEKIFLTFKDINIHWLITGEGFMLTRSIVSNASLNASLNASPNETLMEEDKVSILNESNITEVIKLPEILLPGLEGSYNAFKQKSGNMMPSIMPGDWLICSQLNNEEQIINDMVYIVVSTIGVTCARLFKTGSKDSFALKSDSPAVDTTIQSFSDVMAIYKAEARISYNFQTLDILGDMNEITQIKAEFKALQDRLDQLSQ